jgi:putative DNA primase/helicase
LRRIAASVGTYKPGPEKPAMRTDLGNAQRMVWHHGADLRYSAEWHKWLLWTGTHWQADLDEEVIRRGKQTALSISEEAKRIEDEAEKQLLWKWFAQSQNMARIKAMIESARSEREIAVQQTVFDTNSMLLNTLSGTIDLKTGELRQARRSDLITKVCPVVYDPHARCPTWDRFLHDTFAGDADMIGFIQRAIGYSLTGDVREQKLFFLYGTGANGKSTLMETIGFMLSEYAQRAAFATFTQKASDGGPRNDIARMVGARMVIASEVDAGRRLDEALIKMLTGGDKLSARFLFHEIFEFFPQFKVWIFGNHKPQILGTDHAIWRRIDLIPFEVKIPDAEQDKELKVKLRDELPGILAWAVRGCLDWQQGGLREPPQVLAATAD